MPPPSPMRRSTFFLMRGVATPRIKKKVERRMGDGGGMSGYSTLGY